MCYQSRQTVNNFADQAVRRAGQVGSLGNSSKRLLFHYYLPCTELLRYATGDKLNVIQFSGNGFEYSCQLFTHQHRALI